MEQKTPENRLSVGIDIGSTTAKLVLLNEKNEVLYSKYERHFSQVKDKVLEILEDMKPLLEGKSFSVAVSGSAGLGFAQSLSLPFVQEVYATGEVVKMLWSTQSQTKPPCRQGYL